MDAMQVYIVSIFTGIPKADGEDWIVYVGRRRRLARNLVSTIGFWSEAWARRTVSWHEHVMRTTGIMRSLVMFRNSDWLEAQRSQFVVETGSSASRNSLTAGRTGTRCNIGKPQMRWQAGIALARGFLDSRRNAVQGGSLSVGTRIRQAALLLSQFFNRPP